MEVTEIVKRINNGEKVGDVAKSLGISQSTLSRKLKIGGYTYNQRTKAYELSGNNDDKSRKNVGKSSDKSTNILKKEIEFPLTEDEIKFVKDSYKRRTFFSKDFELDYVYSHLPPRKPEKKTNYIISEETFKAFEEFAEGVGESRRMSRNDLVEMALRKFMDDFR